jgi:hypothetical protein
MIRGLIASFNLVAALKKKFYHEIATSILEMAKDAHERF